MKLIFISIYHLESNDAVKRANRVIFLAITKTLFNLRKRKSVEELPKVVSSHNTTTSRTTRYTPFKLLYGEEAMLPKEVKHRSLGIIQQDPNPDKGYYKESLEASRLEAMENITQYQE